jgi:choline-phosphate cytidylyltransferase
VLRDYDEYLERNLRKGYSAADLNISFVKAQQVRARASLRGVRTFVGRQYARAHGQLVGRLQQWEHALERTLAPEPAVAPDASS